MFRRSFVVASLALAVSGPVVVSAHPHQVRTPHHDQPLANGQNHGPYSGSTACGGDPAAYGLETAHHGPDSGTRGNADGCYTADKAPPTADDRNPAID